MNSLLRLESKNNDQNLNNSLGNIKMIIDCKAYIKITHA